MAAVDHTPVARQLVSQAVHEALRADILEGRVGPGEALPSERALSEAFDVNRHAVREALKRLQQAGLVEIAQGGATRVRDWRACCGLDLIADLGPLARGAQRVELLLAAAEMRASIGADAARLCAQRAPQELRERLRRLAHEPFAGGYEERLRAYERIWESILEGAGNVAYRLAYNTLVTARHGGLDPGIYAREVQDAGAIAQLALAAADGSPEAARDAAAELLARTVETVTEGAR